MFESITPIVPDLESPRIHLWRALLLVTVLIYKSIKSHLPEHIVDSSIKSQVNIFAAVRPVDDVANRVISKPWCTFTSKCAHSCWYRYVATYWRCHLLIPR